MNTGMTEYIGGTMLLLLERGSYRKLWEDLQVGCGWLITRYMKLTVKCKALLTLRTQLWFLDSLFPGESSLELCSFKGNISLALSKWVKNGKVL